MLIMGGVISRVGMAMFVAGMGYFTWYMLLGKIRRPGRRRMKFGHVIGISTNLTFFGLLVFVLGRAIAGSS